MTVLARAARRYLLPLFLLMAITPSAQGAEVLASWNEGEAKQSIVRFVESVSKEGSADFVPVPERIAMFDNDGTLWGEQPMYFQLLFALDRVKALAPNIPNGTRRSPLPRC